MDIFIKTSLMIRVSDSTVQESSGVIPTMQKPTELSFYHNFAVTAIVN